MEYTVPSVIVGLPLILLPIDFIFIIMCMEFYACAKL